MDPTQSPHQFVDDEIDLLDLLVTVADNIKLLVLGPIVVGLAALGISFALPQTYESTAWLGLGEAAAVQMLSRDVLEPVLKNQPHLSAKYATTEQALEAMKKLVQPQFNKKDGLLRLTTIAATPQEAHSLNLMLLEQYRQFSLPKGRALERIQEDIVLQTNAIKELRQVLARLALIIDRVTPSTEGDNVARAYINLSEQLVGREKALADLQRSLQPFGPEAIVQQATLPERATKPKKSLIAVMAALATGFTLLLFVFLRQALRNSGSNPESAAKLARIRRAFGTR
jgi:LPS O-antigen subunit length determinant protein (WzzB/FepE family)